MKLWLAPHSSLHCPRERPGDVGDMTTLFNRPGTASAFVARAGTANLWSTSVLVMFAVVRPEWSVGADVPISRRGLTTPMYLSHRRDLLRSWQNRASVALDMQACWLSASTLPHVELSFDWKACEPTTCSLSATNAGARSCSWMAPTPAPRPSTTMSWIAAAIAD